MKAFEKYFNKKYPLPLTAEHKPVTDHVQTKFICSDTWKAALKWVAERGMHHYGNDFLTDMSELSTDIQIELNMLDENGHAQTAKQVMIQKELNLLDDNQPITKLRNTRKAVQRDWMPNYIPYTNSSILKSLGKLSSFIKSVIIEYPDFKDVLNFMINEEKVFDYSSIESGLWSKVIKAEMDFWQIRFDLENDEPVSDLKEIELDIKYPSGEPVKINAQLYAAGGDWQDSVGYFRCQMDPGKYFLVHIPGPEVNLNLIQRDKGFGVTTDEDHREEEKITRIKDIEEALWDDLRTQLSDRLKGEADPETWELDYKAARVYTGYPK